MAETSTITREGETSAAEHPWPSPERAFWETAREIPHIEARESAKRLVNSHFHNPDSARVSIPANPDYDDDLVLCSYIRQQARKASGAEASHLEDAAIDRALDAFFGHLPHPDKPWGGAWRQQMKDAISAALATGGARG